LPLWRWAVEPALTVAVDLDAPHGLRGGTILSAHTSHSGTPASTVRSVSTALSHPRGGPGGRPAHPMAGVEKRLDMHFALYTNAQARDLAAVYYKFLIAMAQNERRFCTLRASKLRVPLLFPRGMKSPQADSFVTFLTDAHRLVDLHRVKRQSHAVAMSKRKQSAEARAALASSPSMAVSASSTTAVCIAHLGERFAALPPGELLELLADLGSAVPDAAAYATRSVHAPWRLEWFDFLLLAVVEARLWGEFRGLIARWHTFPGDRGDVVARVAYMTMVPHVRELLFDPALSLFPELCPTAAAATPARALIALLPLRLQRLACSQVDSCDQPLVSTREVAAAQMHALVRCARLGDDASYVVGARYFSALLRHARGQKELRRKNLLIRQALDRRFNQGSLQQRFYVRWMRWAHGQARQRRQSTKFAK
jgi:hypothetical protein